MHDRQDPSPPAVPIRVLLVEDHTVVRQAFHLLLADARYGIEVVGEASDGWEAIRLAHLLQPDVILMDLLMPHLDGIQATRAILQHIGRTLGHEFLEGDR